MGFFTLDFRKALMLVLMVAVPLITINLSSENRHGSFFVRPFSAVADWIQQSYSGFSAGVRGTTTMYLDLVGIRKENRRLLDENAELRAQLGALTELTLENERLNQLLAFKQATKMELLAAKVIRSDLIPDHNTVTINRGSSHGVAKNMAALTVGGVVGYVLQAEHFTSTLLLLTDRLSALDAIVQRSRARGIVEGKTKTSCLLRYLQRTDDVKEGDLVVTSGLDHIFPKGFPIGTVTSVEKSDYGMTQEVEIRPAINPFTIEEIFIVLNANNQEFQPETPPSTAATPEPAEK